MMGRALRLTAATAVILLAGCTRYDPLDGLTEAETEAVDHIGRDPGVRIWRTDRDDDGHLIVWTRQGSGRARYRVIEPVEAGEDAEVQVLDFHPSFRRY